MKTVDERFLEKGERSGRGCLEWQSTIHRDGYGKFWFNGKNERAHRVSYILFKGAIPEGLHVLHKCDNRKYVEPTHLYAGTHSQNCKDKVERFKGLWGNMKFSHDQRKEALRLYRAGMSQQSVAATLGMHQASVSRYVRAADRAQAKG